MKTNVPSIYSNKLRFKDIANTYTPYSRLRKLDISKKEKLKPVSLIAMTETATDARCCIARIERDLDLLSNQVQILLRTVKQLKQKSCYLSHQFERRRDLRLALARQGNELALVRAAIARGESNVVIKQFVTPLKQRLRFVKTTLYNFSFCKQSRDLDLKWKYFCYLKEKKQFFNQNDIITQQRRQQLGKLRAQKIERSCILLREVVRKSKQSQKLILNMKLYYQNYHRPVVQKLVFRKELKYFMLMLYKQSLILKKTVHQTFQLTVRYHIMQITYRKLRFIAKMLKIRVMNEKSGKDRCLIKSAFEQQFNKYLETMQKQDDCRQKRAHIANLKKKGLQAAKQIIFLDCQYYKQCVKDIVKPARTFLLYFFHKQQKIRKLQLQRLLVVKNYAHYIQLYMKTKEAKLQTRILKIKKLQKDRSKAFEEYLIK